MPVTLELIFPWFLCRILLCISPSKHTVLGERPGSRDYDLIMTKWEAEGVGRGQEESVVVLRHKQGGAGLPRAEEHATLGAPVPSPKLAGTTKGCSLRAGWTALLKLNEPGLLAHPLCMKQGHTVPVIFRRALGAERGACLFIPGRVQWG